ncbi:1795_t:CDS:2, partial [Gigaspora rosea]
MDHQIVNSDDDNDEKSHEGTLQLYIGHMFNSWEEVDKFLELFGKYKGVSFRRMRNEFHSDHSSIRHCSYKCSYSRVHKAKKAVDITKLNEEARYAWINEQKNTNPTIGLPHIAAIELSFDWDKDFSELENIMKDGCIEDDYERRQMGLRSLLQTLNYKDILQIWAITPQGSFPNHFSNHVKCTYSNFKKSISEKSRWSKGYRISKKALNLIIRLNCNIEFLQIMEEFISSKTHELELLENEKENNENVIESQQSVVANPYITKCCSRPPKRFKDALENTTNT